MFPDQEIYPLSVRPLHLLERKMFYPQRRKIRNRGDAAGPSSPGGPNMLVLGASGHVARAVLLNLARRRAEFGRLVLLDRHDSVLRDPVLDHGKLNYRFLHWRVSLPRDGEAYRQMLKREQIDIVLDLTDMDTIPLLEATDRAGVTYVNTALNDSGCGIAEVLGRIHPHREQPRNAPHILSSGMNPGVVNVWVRHAIEQYGIPSEIVHFEYDTSTPRAGWRPMITWSRQEFLTEVVWERTGVVRNGKLKLFVANALRVRENLAPFLSPVLGLEDYPAGFTVLHEENLKLGSMLGVSSRYIYALHPKTMDYLVGVYNARGTVRVEDLEVGDNVRVKLEGSDMIGVQLTYPGRTVYYLHRLDNEDVAGTNATCAQVACGVEAALSTLLAEDLEPRIYFATDLYETSYSEWVFQNMRIEQYCQDTNPLSGAEVSDAEAVVPQGTT